MSNFRPASDQSIAPLSVKRPKYGNRKTVVDGVTFDSAKEARRWGELRLLARAGAVRNLRRQPRFDLEVNSCRVCAYVADFAYDLVNSTGVIAVVEDVKGVQTETFKLKRKLMRACLGIEVVLT